MPSLDALRARGREIETPRATEAQWVYSATQLSMFHGCPRKWFFKYLLGYPTPTSAAAKLGKELHAEVERYYEDGTIPPSERGKLLIANLPEPSDFTHQEGKILFPVRDKSGPWFTGYIDLLANEPSELVEIIDHKTTSDLKWAKSEWELRSDVQMMSYAHWAFAYPFKNEEELRVTHNVVTTKGKPTPRRTSTTVLRGEVANRWAEHLKIIDDAEEMRRAANGDVRKVEARGIENGECEKYGGCPFAALCAGAQFGQEITRHCDQENEVFNPPDAPAPGEEVKEPVSNKSDILAKLRDRQKMKKSDYDAQKKAEKEAKTAETSESTEPEKTEAAAKEETPPKEEKEKKPRAPRKAKPKPSADAAVDAVDLQKLATAVLMTHKVTSVQVDGDGASIQLRAS